MCLLSACIINVAYAMQKETKSKRRPKSIELGSYFMSRNYPNLMGYTKVDAIDYKINSSHCFSEARLKHMGKTANAILSLDFSEEIPPSDELYEDNVDVDGQNNSNLWDDATITRHEQLARSICPKDDDDEFWKEELPAIEHKADNASNVKNNKQSEPDIQIVLGYDFLCNA